MYSGVRAFRRIGCDRWSFVWLHHPAPSWWMVGPKEDGSSRNVGFGKDVRSPLSEYIGFLHDAAVLEGSPIRFPDNKHPRRHTSIAVCWWHHVLYSGLGDRGSYPIYDDGCLHWFLWSSAESTQSTVVGFGLSAEELSCCAKILATPIETLPLRYLGLPLTDRCLQTQDWQLMMEKEESQLARWRGRLLSRGGRLVLVKTVLSALPTYFRCWQGCGGDLRALRCGSFGAGQIRCEGAP